MQKETSGIRYQLGSVWVNYAYMCNGLLVGIGLRHSWSLLIIFHTIFLFFLSRRKGFYEFPGQSDKVKIVFQLRRWKQQPCYLISALGLISIHFIVSCYVTRGWKLKPQPNSVFLHWIGQVCKQGCNISVSPDRVFKNILKAWSVLWKTVS